MATRLVHRPARTTSTAMSLGPYAIESPPTLPEGDNGARSLLMLVPMLGAGASMTVMMLFRGSSLAAVGALMMVVTILASVVMMFSQRGRAARARRDRRDRYLAYLEQRRSDLVGEEEAARTSLRDAHPQTGALLAVAMNPATLWDQRRADPDYLHMRLGSGRVASRAFQTSSAESALADVDDFMIAELEGVRRRFGQAGEVPVTLPVASTGVISVVGDAAFCRAVGRILLCQMAARVAPEDLMLALVTPEARREGWVWAQWLPHLADQARPTAHGPSRRIHESASDLRRAWSEELNARSATAAEGRRHVRLGQGATHHPRFVAVLDGHGAPAADLGSDDPELSLDDLGVTLIHLLADRLHEPGEVALRITQESATRFRMDSPRDERPTVRGVLDPFTEAEAEALARTLAPLRLSPDSLEHDAGRRSLAFTELMGVTDPAAFDPGRTWSTRSETTFLRVPLGIDDEGDPVMLDLKEAAQFGMGPHGLCIGATGSGKSELLRTLVLGLLATHGPEDVNLVLVDYKGGASFAPFADAPQVSGVITNLSDDSSLVERVYTSLNGEVQRRQQVLRDAGNLPDITAYRQHRANRRAAGEELPPLPHLLVIIDEFGELLTARPDFIELFLTIGRIGRSIGVHLLLSSQRIEGGRLRGLDTYLSYRIGMRTLSEAESRSVLDTPDAFSLPPVPGYAYLKVDTTTYVRFRSGFVSGPLPAATEGPPSDAVEPGAADLVPLSFYPTASSAAPFVDVRPGPSLGPDVPTVLTTMVSRLAQRPRATAPVWLPPLPDRLTLDSVVGRAEVTRAGLRIRRGHGLRVCVGLVDDPARQEQRPWEVDLGAAGGHVLVLGAPGAGKTTFLRTLAVSLALSRRPRDVSIHAIDLVGANLQGLSDLPNVAGVGSRVDREVVRRTVEEVQSLVSERELLMQAHGVDSVAALRAARSTGDVESLDRVNLADIVLLVDGFGQLSAEFDALESLVGGLVQRGAAYGVHVVATATRWNEVRLGMQSFFGNRIELRLGDPGESAFGRRKSETISPERPGRALVSGAHFAHVALPRMDGVAAADDAAAALRHLVGRIAENAPERATRVRLLPREVPAADVEVPAVRGRVALGLDEKDLATVHLDVTGSDRNLMVIGDPRTGRTNVLRRLVSGLVAACSSEEVVIAVIDPRRTLQGVVPEEYLGGYAGGAALAERLVAAVVTELERRVTQIAESDGAAFDGPEVVVLVDDYDVLTAGGGSPLAPLRPYIAMGQEIGLSVVLTRRTAGAARGVFDPIFTAVREAGGTGLLLSGDRSEGQLFGAVRPTALPVGRAQLIRTGAPVSVVQVALER